ncbi:MAG: hypothetical protein K2N87_05790 [Eubacterium sp.]|nr:hypothetical protein [Eubacterium sp.]
MLQIENEYIKRHILDGCFGLEKESLRVLSDGTLSHTPHPFPDDMHIVKDFCENQTEINTSVHDSARAAVEELEFHNQRIYKKLQALPQKEYLWPFSNPPYIKNEKDIPVAVFGGAHVSKKLYRDYLSLKYGRYRMAFSGIHVNFSFSEELLKTDFRLQEYTDYTEYKNRLYLNLAKRMAAYGWILTAVTAASPVMDSSFVEKGIYGRDVFTGMASVRCSELGYWNEFSPVFHYESLEAYAAGIQKYVEKGLLRAPSELYYPIRLKPKGENDLDTLRTCGVNHIELRMFDLNPLTETGIEEKDILFAQLLMAWLSATPEEPFTQKDQIQAVQNFKNAARYDLKTVRILAPDGAAYPAADAAARVIERMMDFYQRLGILVQDVLEFEHRKFTDAQHRYAWKIRKRFGNDYVKKGLELAKERQEEKCVNCFA